LAAILPALIAAQVNFQRLILVTDSMAPDDVAEHGHMDHVVRRAISLGLTPMQAIQAATLNPATCSGLEQEIGGIAPGRFADIALIEDLQTCRVREVLIGGKVAARGGVAEIKNTAIELPADMMHSLSVGTTITPETFKVSSPASAPRVRVMELVNQTITAERIVEMDGRGGAVEADVSRDILKVAMFDRHRRSPQVAFGFLKGFGARVGAVGLTVNLDENSLLIIGNSDFDMALCADALLEAGGGIAVVDHGEIVEKTDFPLGGIFSLRPWQEVGVDLRRIHGRLKKMGSSFDKPIFPLIFLPFVTLPALRITARGLVSPKERKLVPLFAA
jgi:adenine deaminase